MHAHACGKCDRCPDEPRLRIDLYIQSLTNSHRSPDWIWSRTVYLHFTPCMRTCTVHLQFCLSLKFHLGIFIAVFMCFFYFFFRYCVCTTCFGTRKIVKPFRSHLLSNHPANCPCDCGTCSEKNVDRKLWTPIGFRRTSYVPRLSFFMAVNTTIIVGNVFS